MKAITSEKEKKQEDEEKRREEKRREEKRREEKRREEKSKTCPAKEIWNLRLYVAGQTPKSIAAFT